MGNLCKPNDFDEINSTLNVLKKESPQKNIKEIENLKIKIRNIPLFERGLIAETKYNNLKNKKVGKEDQINDNKKIMAKYIEIIELMLLNNTNKKITKLYLDFIKNNENFINIFKLNNYKDELKKYKILFTKDEINKIEREYKTIGEKENYVNFLIYLSTEKDDNKIYSKANELYNKIYYFNYPIEFSNQELFYYKLFALLIIAIHDNNRGEDWRKEQYISNKRKIAKIIIDNNILYNRKIIYNEDKMNILTTLIIFEQLNEQGESINFKRLLQTEKASFETLKKFVNDNNIGIMQNKTIDNEGNFVIKGINGSPKNIIVVNINDVCLNILKDKDLDLTFTPYKCNTLDSLLKDHPLSKYIGRIKSFLIKIIYSKSYNDIIKQLFPDYSTFLLGDNLKTLEKFINQRLKFYPYKIFDISGVTDKFSCYSYISILEFQYLANREDYKKILRIGAVIENTLQEINHINQDFIFFKINEQSLFRTSKITYLNIEGGEDFEILLFGRKIGHLRFLEALYLLNENNYEQSLENFRSNFKNLYNGKIEFSKKIKFLKIDGIFKDICIDINNYSKKEVNEIKTYGINTKNQYEIDEIIYIPKNNCKMGDLNNRYKEI